MKLINTSIFPTNELREIITIAKGSIKTNGVLVRTKNSKSTYNGRFWQMRPGTGEPLIILRLGNNTYPKSVGHKYKHGKKRYILINNWQELAVYILAHEFKHLKLWQNKKSQSEVKCDVYGIKRLEVFRMSEFVKVKQLKESEFSEARKRAIAEQKEKGQDITKQMKPVVKKENETRGRKKGAAGNMIAMIRTHFEKDKKPDFEGIAIETGAQVSTVKTQWYKWRKEQ